MVWGNCLQQLDHGVMGKPPVTSGDKACEGCPYAPLAHLYCRCACEVRRRIMQAFSLGSQPVAGRPMVWGNCLLCREPGGAACGER